MRKCFFILFVLFLCAGCSGAVEITEEAIGKYEVKQTFDEKEEADFIFRFVSEKDVYEEGEEVELYGELMYTGDGKIAISHASSYLLFTAEERVRDVSFSTVVREIGVEKELHPMEPYRQNFIKQDIFDSESEEEAYRIFINDFKENDSFPPGYYIVHAVASFFDGREHREIEAEVDFKVLPVE